MNPTPTVDSVVPPDAVATARRSWHTRNVAAPLQHHFRSLLASLRQPVGEHEKPPRVVGITSTGHQAGVSSVALNLATYAARNLDRDVVLVDGHCDHSGLAKQLKVAGAPGLGEFLRGEADLPDCLHRSDDNPFVLLPAGKGAANCLDEPNGTTALFESLREQFALVLVDMPSVADLGNCLTLAQHTDGLLFVIAAERTDAHHARRAVAQLARCHVPILGAVLNGSRTP